MFYFLSKLLDVFFTPLAWSVALVIVGLGGKKPPGRRRWFAVAGLVVLLFFSLEPVSNALFRSLERPPSRTFHAGTTYDVAILLGGVVDDRVEATSGERAYNDDNERLLETFDLLRTGATRYAIISGGPASSARTAVIEAPVLADQLVAWGIARDRIVVEARARNTHENAVYSAAIVRARGWQRVVVVTSAFHMPRAIGCFRAEHLDVDALPVDFRTYASPYGGDSIPRAVYLEESSAAFREWFGRAVYRLRGYAR